MNVSFIIPTRNNLPYLKWAHGSIRHFYPEAEIIILDDCSSDGTEEWANDQSNSQSEHTSYYKNDVRQVGHTVLYDKGVELCDNDIFTIFHADMVCGPNYLENLLKHLEEGTVVSGTRIEPPLHPAGKEKIVQDFGIYADKFKGADFNAFCLQSQEDPENKGITTKGIFAPWIMYKKDFLAIGGHDKLFAPFPYEDSDIFQRFILKGYKIKQARDAFVYHFTCRGHRWTEQVQKDDLFYKLCCAKNSLHFIRKWGHWIENDEFSHPVIHKKYDIGLKIKNCSSEWLGMLEPWFSTVYADCNIQDYINKTQPSTPFDLTKRVKLYNELISHDIIVTVDGNTLNNNNAKILTSQLSKMIAESGEVGIMEFDSFRIEINDLTFYENRLVNNDNSYYQNQLCLNASDPYCLDELFKTFDNIKKNNI